MDNDERMEHADRLTKRRFFSPPFLVCAVILAVSAAALTPAMSALARKYRKKSIPLRLSLHKFDPSKLPSFQDGWTVNYPEVLSEGLGTKEYAYVEFVRKNVPKSQGCVRLFVTYYSDPRDKVPHTPEVCIRQEGAVVHSLSKITLDTPQLAPKQPRVPVHLVRAQRPDHNVILMYVFCVEGQFRCEREEVRWIMAKPGNKRVYFSKIEVSAFYPFQADPQPLIEAGKTLLREALPVLVKEHFPADSDLKRP